MRGSGIGIDSPSRFINLADDSLDSRLTFAKVNANFMTQRYNVRDGVILHMFVRHEAYDQFENLLPSDGTNFPGAKKADKNSGKTKRENYDPAVVESSDDEDSDFGGSQEEEDGPAVKTHKFTIDFIIRYPDQSDDIILHWGMSRKKIGAWGTPDMSFQPPNSKQWPDGLACQTSFQRESDNQSIRTIQVVLKWVVDIEPPVHSISFVITEKNKNLWHSINGTDTVITFCPEPEVIASAGDGGQLPRGIIGEAV